MDPRREKLADRTSRTVLQSHTRNACASKPPHSVMPAGRQTELYSWRRYQLLTGSKLSSPAFRKGKNSRLVTGDERLNLLSNGERLPPCFAGYRHGRIAQNGAAKLALFLQNCVRFFAG